jgi:hypothetical protein
LFGKFAGDQIIMPVAVNKNAGTADCPGSNGKISQRNYEAPPPETKAGGSGALPDRRFAVEKRKGVKQLVQFGKLFFVFRAVTLIPGRTPPGARVALPLL